MDSNLSTFSFIVFAFWAISNLYFPQVQEDILLFSSRDFIDLTSMCRYVIHLKLVFTYGRRQVLWVLFVFIFLRFGHLVVLASFIK